MTTSDTRLKDAVRRYLETVNSNVPEAMVQLYRSDARVEDPVGSGKLLVGHEDIRAFYENAFAVPLTVQLETEPRGSFGDAAAYAFRVTRGTTTLKVIGVLTFDEQGLITTMRAFYGPSDITTA
ncbi:nuclear transport factor 2 family protein [Iodidimonas sp. SYSU 1G8]|uniref:nuclear transport factor 2 family protein n=1 Tax=Iodidimonas sp. SYSU 1G8 TaxID=3133967 RepID=UPI0031FEB0DA